MTDPEAARRCWAVVPAAGLSRRMGRPKLLLRLGGRTVIERLAEALTSGGVTAVHVLVREDDRELREHLEQLPVCVHEVSRPTNDMRESVERLLEEVEARHAPSDADAWLLCPADHPVLSAELVQNLLAASAAAPGAIVAPVHSGRRGHPVIFPWPLAARVRELPPGEGINALTRSGWRRVDVPVNDPSIHLDLDTPEDFAAIVSRFQQGQRGEADESSR